jgi:serine/threonine protein kinase
MSDTRTLCESVVLAEGISLRCLESRSSKQSYSLNALEERYLILEFIAAGAFGTVWSAECLFTGKRCAVKSFNKCIRDVSSGLETQGLWNSHKNIVNYLEKFEDVNECHIVMELCDGMDLQKNMISSSPAISRIDSIMEQLTEAIQYLHLQNIAHCDIRAENAVIDDLGSVKLIDFGSAINLNSVNDEILKSEIIQEDWNQLDALRIRLVNNTVAVNNDYDDDRSTVCSATNSPRTPIKPFTA